MTINATRHTLAIATLAITASLGVTTTASAAAITPQYDSFGPLPQATFGGTGIPNDAVAISTFMDGDNTITLGLTATERYIPPAVGNDGAGTFFAEPGSFPGTGNPSGPPADSTYARWNISYYANIEGGGTLSDYDFNLLYDFDPGVNTDESDHGVVVIDNFSYGNPTTVQDSQNLGSFFLRYLNPEASFDPTANGEYTFSLRAIRSSVLPLDLGLSTLVVGNTMLGQSAIRVNVGDVAAVPEPSSLAMLGMGLIGLLLCVPLRRRQMLADS